MSETNDNEERPITAEEALRARIAELEAALRDMLSGWRYIRQMHGDLPGVGWDRCEQSASRALGEETRGG